MSGNAPSLPTGTAAAPVPEGFAALADTIGGRLAGGGHGDLPRWLAALADLPDLPASAIEVGDTVTVRGSVSDAQRERLRAALDALHPWRKGPFSLFGVHIDSEWRSDWKWRRVAPHLRPLDGARVLDVGSGNGYFGWRMLAGGAREVVGVDPTLLFCLQHQAVCRYLGGARNHVLPLRFEELPGHLTFDAVFSMGVIYHRRDPMEHAARLHRHTRPGGQVVVESLVVQAAESLLPAGRYARMRNVHVVPTPARLMAWLSEAGFAAVRLADLTPTTPAEQRSTGWMRFQSLADALDPDDPTRTVEGHPAPLRAVVVAERVY